MYQLDCNPIVRVHNVFEMHIRAAEVGSSVLTGWGNTAPWRETAVNAVILQELKGLKENELDKCGTDVRLPLKDHHMFVSSEKTSGACQGDSG